MISSFLIHMQGYRFWRKTIATYCYRNNWWFLGEVPCLRIVTYINRDTKVVACENKATLLELEDLQAQK